MRALVGVGYDAMCVGNHEFDHGLDNLERILRRARPPAVLANVHEPLPRTEPWRVVRRAGVRVAFVGLVTPATPAITHPDARTLEFRDPVVVLGEALAELEGRVDLVVPLTHQGIEDDRRLAEAYPELPLVVGGHSHSFLRAGERVGDTLIVQAGSRAGAVGRVDLWFDRARGRVVEARAELVDLDAGPEPVLRRRAVDRACETMVSEGTAFMDEVVGELEAPLTRSREPSSSSAGNWIADRMRAVTGAEVAVHNRGGIRAGIPAGPVTRRDLFEVVPFDNTVVALELRGDELREAVRRGVESLERTGIEVSGMRLRVRRGPDDAVLLDGVLVDGRPLDGTRVYTVATNSFLAEGGDGYFGHVRGRPATVHPILLRDMLEEAFATESSILPPADDRYEVLE